MWQAVVTEGVPFLRGTTRTSFWTPVTTAAPRTSCSPTRSSVPRSCSPNSWRLPPSTPRWKGTVETYRGVQLVFYRNVHTVDAQYLSTHCPIHKYILYITKVNIVQYKSAYCTVQKDILYSTKVHTEHYKSTYCTVRKHILYSTKVRTVQYISTYYTVQKYILYSIKLHTYSTSVRYIYQYMKYSMYCTVTKYIMHSTLGTFPSDVLVLTSLAQRAHLNSW